MSARYEFVERRFGGLAVTPHDLVARLDRLLGAAKDP
jgi:hypothetical protein